MSHTTTGSRAYQDWCVCCDQTNPRPLDPTCTVRQDSTEVRKLAGSVRDNRRRPVPLKSHMVQPLRPQLIVFRVKFGGIVTSLFGYSKLYGGLEHFTVLRIMTSRYPQTRPEKRFRRVKNDLKFFPPLGGLISWGRLGVSLHCRK